VRALLPHVERAEQRLDAAVHGRDLIRGEQAAGDAGLVGDDADGYPRVP
jgi:hypothetical protein